MMSTPHSTESYPANMAPNICNLNLSKSDERYHLDTVQKLNLMKFEFRKQIISNNPNQDYLTKPERASYIVPYQSQYHPPLGGGRNLKIPVSQHRILKSSIDRGQSLKIPESPHNNPKSSIVRGQSLKQVNAQLRPQLNYSIEIFKLENSPDVIRYSKFKCYSKKILYIEKFYNMPKYRDPNIALSQLPMTNKPKTKLKKMKYKYTKLNKKILFDDNIPNSKVNIATKYCKTTNLYHKIQNKKIEKIRKGSKKKIFSKLEMSSIRDFSTSITSEKKLRNKLIKSLNGNIKNQICILLWNKGNSLLKNKIQELRDIVTEKKPEIFVVNEFNHSNEEDMSPTHIEGYQIELDTVPDGSTTHRNAIYIKNNIIYQREKKFEAPNSSNICLKIGFKGMRKFYINGFYNQWQILYKDKTRKEQSSLPSNFNNRFLQQAELWEDQIINNPGTECIIIGDFNIDNKLILNNDYPNPTYASKYQRIKKYIKEKLLDNGMRLVNSSPTRFEGGIERGLDHIYTNRIDKLYNFTQTDHTSSDHSMLQYQRHMKVQACEESYILTRQWEKIDFDLINENILNSENYNEALHDNDPNKIAEFMIHQINYNLDLQSELKKVKVKNTEQMKYTKETLEKIRIKNELYKKVKIENLAEDKLLLKNMNKNINKCKMLENKETNRKKFEKCKGNSKQEWRLAKEKLFGKIEKHPERILENNKMKFGSRQVAGVFNRYFISKIRNIRKSIPTRHEDPMMNYRKYIKTPKTKLYFKKITMNQLKKKVAKMKKSNTISHDRISMNTLNKLKISIFPLLLNLINSINRTNIFPECLKISRIFPILKSKSESPLDCSNYRPVNLLSPISKIIEKFWSNDIINHLKINKLIDANHQGGLPNRSSTTTILEIYNRMSIAKMKKKHAAIISMDQSGAFDVVDHPILLEKLRHIGLSNEAVATIQSFLKNRKQFVQINANSSDILITGEVGTVQGSVMSGLLYAIYILDMNSLSHKKRHKNHSSYNICPNPNINTFVDDCFATIETNDKNEIWNKIINFIKSMNQYYTNNSLMNNIKKTKILIITENKEIKEMEMKIENILLKHTGTIKILGTVISDDLKWNVHLRTGKESLI